MKFKLSVFMSGTTYRRSGDTVFAFNEEGTPYGVCGAVLATQADPSRQIEFKRPKQLRGRTQFVAMLDDKAWEE